jgi:hypothetical protein
LSYNGTGVTNPENGAPVYYRPEDASYGAQDALLVPPGQSAKFLGIEDARQLINAAMFAAWRKHPFTVCATIRWDTSTNAFDPSPRAWIVRQGRLFERMSRWLERNGIPVSYAWTREVSRTRIPHSHILLHLPFKHWTEFRAFMVESGGFRDGVKPFDPVYLEGGEYGTYSLPMRAGKLKYLLKGMNTTETFRDATNGRTVNLMDALRVDNRDEERMPLAGKRTGVSRTLDRLARAVAGWQELLTVKELHRALNP